MRPAYEIFSSLAAPAPVTASRFFDWARSQAPFVVLSIPGSRSMCLSGREGSRNPVGDKGAHCRLVFVRLQILLTSCAITASRLVILRRRPFSVIFIGWFGASFSQVFRTRRPPTRAAGLAVLETGLPRRLAVAHPIIALRPGRHFVLSA